MPSITVKSIPDELYERIKQSAAEHRRSINKEVIICLERHIARQASESCGVPGARGCLA